MEEHKSNKIQRDDVTLVGIKPLGATKPDKKEIEYRGVVTYSAMTNFGEQFTEKFEPTLSRKVFRACYFTLNELMQNISFYSAETATIDKKKYGIGQIKIISTDDKVTLEASNVVTNENYKILQERIEKYNTLSYEELKMLSKEKRKSVQAKDSKGGGIGLIEIRKKTKKLLQCSLITRNNKNKIFIRISLGETDG